MLIQGDSNANKTMTHPVIKNQDLLKIKRQRDY